MNQKKFSDFKTKNILLKYFHCLNTEQWDYYENIQNLFKYEMNDVIKPLPKVIRQIYEHVSTQRNLDPSNYKTFKYKIINDENFICFK